MSVDRAEKVDQETDWLQLDPRTVLVRVVLFSGVLAGAALPTAFGLAGSRPLWQAFAWVATGVALALAVDIVAETVRFRRTRYRVGRERVELHTGLLVVQRRSLTRERIRSADLTANPFSASSASSRSGSAPASTPRAASPPSNSTWSPGPRVSGSGTNCSPAPPSPPSRTRSTTPPWPSSTRAGSVTPPSPSSPPPSVARRPAPSCRSASGSAHRGRSSTG